MKVKIYIFIILAALYFNPADVLAQCSSISFKSHEFLHFKASKTYALLTGDKDYDDAMSAALNECWKITPFDFIDVQELKKKIRDKNASFILPITISGEYIQYDYLALVNGGGKNLGHYSFEDMIAFASIDHYGDEPNSTDCAPRLINMLESMLNAMNIVEQNDFKGNGNKIIASLFDYYRSQSYKIKDRVLLFNKDNLGKKLNGNDISNIYPYKFELCSQQKINDAIKNKDKNYYYFQPGLALGKCEYVFDPATGEVVYANEKITGMYIKKGEIEDLVKAINKK